MCRVQIDMGDVGLLSLFSGGRVRRLAHNVTLHNYCNGIREGLCGWVSLTQKNSPCNVCKWLPRKIRIYFHLMGWIKICGEKANLVSCGCSNSHNFLRFARFLKDSHVLLISLVIM